VSWKWPFKESIHFEGQWYNAYSSVGPRKPEKWIKLILDFGEGGEHAAEESHNKILRSKTSEAYRKRCGAYTILRDDQPFCTDKGKSTKEEKAEDESIFLRYNFAAKNIRRQKMNRSFYDIILQQRIFSIRYI
jgi:hypothetical protein